MDSSLPPFDPGWLKHQDASGGFMVMPVEPAVDSRQRFAAIFEAMADAIPPRKDTVSTKDVKLNSNGLWIRIYTPVAAAKSGKLLPLGLYIHAGGWFAGSVENEDHVARMVCETAEVILISPEYRLAPENPYPAGLNDCCEAYEWMHNHAAELGGDANKKSTMGGSAAGNLSLAVACKYADTDLKPIGLIVAALASCDPKALPEEYKKAYTPELYRDAPMIGNEIVAQAREWYGAKPDDPLASPLLHPNLKLINKIYITACTKDPTHQETQFLYQECKKLGVNAEYIEWVGWPHYFWVLPMLEKSNAFLHIWCDKLRWINEG